MCSIFQVAIHSVLENFFRKHLEFTQQQSPVCYKILFRLLDAQAENKKITDPDVVHIWKTKQVGTIGDYRLMNLGQNLN